MKTLYEQLEWAFIGGEVDDISKKCVSAANELMRWLAETVGYGVWHFDTKRHYKIWFSNNPNEFMDFENQLRLVLLTANNPSMNLVLIYSSRCLNVNAINALSEFCAAHRIKPVDINKDIKAWCEHPYDIALYEQALDEIEYKLSAKGGNFAAASDCVRLIIPIIAKFGMYNDFETQLDIESYPAIVKCLTPIILKKGNNDSIAVAVDPNDITQLDSVAMTMIRNAQYQLLQNYKQYGEIIISSSRFNDEKHTRYAQVTKKYIELYPNSTVYDLRRFINEITLKNFTELLDDYAYVGCIGRARDALFSEEQLKHYYAETTRKLYDCNHIDAGSSIELADKLLQIQQQCMLVLSITIISGPDVMDFLFAGDYQKLKRYSDREENIEKMFVDDNKTFKPCYIRTRKDLDGSWGPAGEQLKQSKSDKIKNKIVFFQSVIRGNNVRNSLMPAPTYLLGQLSS